MCSFVIKILELHFVLNLFSNRYLVSWQRYQQINGTRPRRRLTCWIAFTKRAFTGSTQIGLDSIPNWTLDEYCRAGATLLDVKLFETMAVDGKSLVVYNCNRFKRDAALSAWKKWWAVLIWPCVGTIVDTLLANMPFDRRKQKQPYCCRIRDAIDANIEVAEGDLELSCWLFDKPYTIMYPLRDGAQRTKAQKLEICH